MAPIRYSLHYEDYSEHLMSRFGKLLQMQSLVDMTLMCSSHTLRVHKAVLAASSAYFQEVLQKQTGEPLIILKMRFNVLKCLVEFMYCGKTQCLEENLDELVSAAQFLKIKGLSKVTKEGLGITGNTDLPVFTPPVVINRPPQSLIDLHLQDVGDALKPPPPPPSQMVSNTTSNQPVDSMGRINKDMVVRIPFDIEGGGGAAPGDYSDPQRIIKPRRGRPSVRRSSGWEAMPSVAGLSAGAAGMGGVPGMAGGAGIAGAGMVGGAGMAGAGMVGGAGGPLPRAAERALLRREQDSRKAIHQLKHLQTRQMQEYMDRVTLSQAVNSICGPETTASSYINLDNDLQLNSMYMDQSVTTNPLDSSLSSYSKDHPMSSDTITSSYTNPATSSANGTANTGMGTAMSQYVSALKNAGLPTDLPILFESSDGSYINVNEQVLLDMVQSSEIQYEVIEQPNIIEKVADPSEIKSIDDLSKSIERGEVMMGSKGFSSTDFGKDTSEFSRHEEAINSLNAILPDNLESYADQQNYVVLDPRQCGSSMDHQSSNDFSSCIDSDMHFFTKSMSDDVKKYYDQQLNDSREMEQLCPGSSSLDTNFSMSLLDTKNPHLSENMSQQYHLEDLRRTDDCYDFGLQLPQGPDFKDDALDCLMATPKATDDERNTFADGKTAEERDAIIKDLMNLENNMTMTDNGNGIDKDECFTTSRFNEPEVHSNLQAAVDNLRDATDITSSGLQWDDIDSSKNDSANKIVESCLEHESILNSTPSEFAMDSQEIKWSLDNTENNKENIPEDDRSISISQENIPFAVGLLPLKQVQPADDNSLLKRKSIEDDDLLDNIDAKCLRRKIKHKKM